MMKSPFPVGHGGGLLPVALAAFQKVCAPVRTAAVNENAAL